MSAAGVRSCTVPAVINAVSVRVPPGPAPVVEKTKVDPAVSRERSHERQRMDTARGEGRRGVTARGRLPIHQHLLLTAEQHRGPSQNSVITHSSTNTQNTQRSRQERTGAGRSRRAGVSGAQRSTCAARPDWHQTGAVQPRWLSTLHTSLSLPPETLEHAATGRDALLEPTRPRYDTQHADRTASESPGNLPFPAARHNSC